MLKNSQFAKSFSQKLGSVLAFIPIHPNSITILSVIMAALGYLSWNYSQVSQVYGFVFFLLAFFFDAVDGAIARAKKLESKEGAFLDGISDRIVEFFVIIALMKTAPGFQLPLAIILFFGAGMTAFVKAYAEHSQVLNHEEALKMPGFLERAERSVLLLCVMLLSIFGALPIFTIVLYFTALMSALTFIQRFFFAYGKAK